MLDVDDTVDMRQLWLHMRGKKVRLLEMRPAVELAGRPEEVVVKFEVQKEPQSEQRQEHSGGGERIQRRVGRAARGPKSCHEDLLAPARFDGVDHLLVLPGVEADAIDVLHALSDHRLDGGNRGLVGAEVDSGVPPGADDDLRLCRGKRKARKGKSLFGRHSFCCGEQQGCTLKVVFFTCLEIREVKPRF